MNMFFMNDTENPTIQYTLYKNPAVLRKAIRDGLEEEDHAERACSDIVDTMH